MCEGVRRIRRRPHRTPIPSTHSLPAITPVHLPIHPPTTIRLTQWTPPHPSLQPQGDPDFVLDCIDDVETKAELLGYCQAKGLRVIASLGAGLKV